jgi:hypothetical protein
MEFDSPVGPAKACGGIALIRVEAYRQVGGYNPTLIAGEEPEMCFRMRQDDWTIQRIDHDMVLHDVQMDRFGQWWRRHMRGGWAYAEGAAMHGASPERYNRRQTLSVWFWGLLYPAVVLLLLWPTMGVSLVLLVAYPLLVVRVQKARERRGDVSKHARLYAIYCVLGKFPMMVGTLKYWFNRTCGRRAHLIEYKGSVVAEQ